MIVKLPELSLVCLIGPTGSGKSFFAEKYFDGFEVLSSDYFRGLVMGDENSLDDASEAFDALHMICEKRLKKGLLTVVDATNCQEHAREKLVALAEKNHVQSVAVVINTPLNVCKERQKNKFYASEEALLERQKAAVRHHKNMRKSLKYLKKEGFSDVYVVDDISDVKIERVPLKTDFSFEQNNLQIVGDVHGCYDELILLLESSGWNLNKENENSIGKEQISNFSLNNEIKAPNNTKLVFVGDLVDRGPESVKVLKLVMELHEKELAYVCMGNHDKQLYRYLQNKKPNLKYGLEETVSKIEKHEINNPGFKKKLKDFYSSLQTQYLFDEGKLLVVHAGLPEEMHNRVSKEAEDTAVFGVSDGTKNSQGRKERIKWQKDYRGQTTVVYGHTPTVNPSWENKTINIDTGCVFGGSLTAFCWPSKQTISIKALKTYESDHDIFVKEDRFNININDVLKNKKIETKTGEIFVSEEQSFKAIETLSRFSIDPKWLIYLPPTVSPVSTSRKENYLEHPEDAFYFYKKAGQKQIIMQEKHMGSRMLVLICKNEQASQKYFDSNKKGVCYTRTGRAFFENSEYEQKALQEIDKACEKAELWKENEWLLIDGELMPWSFKAQELINELYEPTGKAGLAYSQAAQNIFSLTKNNENIIKEFKEKETTFKEYNESYLPYVKKVETFNDLQFAPFHIVASNKQTFFDKTHVWHMEQTEKLAEHSKFIVKTDYMIVDLENQESQQKAIEHWQNKCEQGSEGVMIKTIPYFVCNEQNTRIPTMLKVRGQKYLRLIYGPEYTIEKNMIRLKQRNLKNKRNLALKEQALGETALEKFINQEPFYETHQAIAAILALENQKIDPRL